MPLAREETPAALAGLPRHLPTVIPVEQYLVVASTTWSHDWAVAQDSAESDLRRCGAALGMANDTVRAFLDERPWNAFDAEVRGLPYVLFQAMPLDLPTAECLRSRLYDPRYLQRGILLSTASLLDAGNNVSDVDVFADERFVSPTIYGRVPVAATDWLRPSPTRTARPDVRQVRVYVPMQALDPRNGRFPFVVLRVWNAYLKMITVPIPEPLTRRMWAELLPWRIEQHRASVTGGPAVPLPNDRTLQLVVRRYQRGEIVDAAEQAAAWRALDRARRGTDSTTTSSLRHDRLIADVMVGGVLAAAGDTGAATALADDALATAPCLVPSTPATAAYATLLNRRRPNVRCSTVTESSVMRHGLAFPGGGHSVVGDRGLAIAATSAVAVALGGAVAATVAAGRRYDNYKKATTVDLARTRYAGASSMRDLATGLAIGGAVLWIGDMGYAVLRERRHTRRVRAQQSFGR
jgi:hypothetical protein